MTESWGGALLPESHDPEGCIEAECLGPLRGLGIATYVPCVFLQLSPLRPQLHARDETEQQERNLEVQAAWMD